MAVDVVVAAVTAPGALWLATAAYAGLAMTNNEPMTPRQEIMNLFFICIHPLHCVVLQVQDIGQPSLSP
ncbi:hypothetical protein SD51_04770 [Alicyclobacillus tengchongensis]|nr:hypothetical protein SD51_04770 [Alicyclobacillus tengchongensis]